MVRPGEFQGDYSLPLPLGSVLVIKGNGADVVRVMIAKGRGGYYRGMCAGLWVEKRKGIRREGDVLRFWFACALRLRCATGVKRSEHHPRRHHSSATDSPSNHLTIITQSSPNNPQAKHTIPAVPTDRVSITFRKMDPKFLTVARRVPFRGGACVEGRVRGGREEREGACTEVTVLCPCAY